MQITYSPGSDKLTEVPIVHVNFMSTRQPGNSSLSDVYFFDFAIKAAKSENNEGFSTSEKARISSRVGNSSHFDLAKLSNKLD